MITYGSVKCQTDGCDNELQYFGNHLFGGNITNDGVYCFKCLQVKNNPDACNTSVPKSTSPD